MEGKYSVTVDGSHAGKVVIQKKGLYYHFSCRCCLPGDMLYRLVVSSGGIQENLGILVPKECGFGLDTQLPVKRIGKGQPTFFLVPKQQSLSGIFIPIKPEEPFAYISRLKRSFLVLQNGESGIIMDKMQEQ